MVKVNFVDFWEDFDSTKDPIFGTFLDEHYGVDISHDPDFLFYSVCGNSHKDSRWNRCTKIFYTAENRGTPARLSFFGRLKRLFRRFKCFPIRPSEPSLTKINFYECDFAISHYYINDRRHLRLPNYVRRYGLEKVQSLKNPKDVDKILDSKTKFCCFVYSNPNSNRQGVALRNELFKKLSQYKRVDSAGKILNNMNGFVVSRDYNIYIEFISHYKFMITFENSQAEGYTTEKIYHAMLANTIPIYWGNPLVHYEFNEKSFINCHRFENQDGVIKKVIELDQNDKMYRQYLSEPCLTEGGYLEEISEETLLKFFNRIFRTKNR